MPITVEDLNTTPPQVGVTVTGLDDSVSSVISVQRSWDDGWSWHTVQGADHVSVTGAWFVRDFAPPLNVEAIYQVVVHSGPGLVARTNLATNPSLETVSGSTVATPVVRTNAARDPLGATISAGGTQTGGITVTESTSATGGPDAEVPSYYRRAYSSYAGSANYWSYHTESTTELPVTPGRAVRIGCWARSSVAKDAAPAFSWRDGGGAFAAWTIAPERAFAADTWQWVSWVAQAPATAGHVVGAVGNSTVTAPAGAWSRDVSGWCIEDLGRYGIVCVGDSITEGYNAGTPDSSWPSQLAGLMGGEAGFIPAGSNMTGMTYPVTRTGSITLTGEYGVGLRVAQMTSATAQVVITFDGVGGKLLFQRGVAGAVMGVQVDGGAVTLVDTSGTFGPDVYDLGTLSAGTHTVTVTYDASSPAASSVYLNGLLTYETTSDTAGVRVINSGHSGHSTVDYTTGDREDSLALAIAQAGGADMATVLLGTNDDIDGVSAAAYGANVQAIVDSLRSSGGVRRVLLMTPYLAASSDSATIDAYHAELAAIAAADESIHHIDLRDLFPNYGDPGYATYFSDSTHPNATGYALLAEIVATHAQWLGVGEFFGGGVAKGAPFDAHFTGTTNASSSVMVPAGAAYPNADTVLDLDGVGAMPTGGSAAAVRSSGWASSGTYSVAVVPAGGEFSSVYLTDTSGGTAALGLTKGATYTISATLYLPHAQQSPDLTDEARRIIVGGSPGGVIDFGLAQSAQAPNVAGEHRVSVTFTVPADDDDFFVRLMNGSPLSTDVVWWDDVLISTDGGTYFDGDTAISGDLAYGWTGTANASTSLETTVSQEAAPITLVSSHGYVMDPLDPSSAVAFSRRSEAGALGLLGSSLNTFQLDQGVDMATPLGASLPVASVAQRQAPSGLTVHLHSGKTQVELRKSLLRLLKETGHLVVTGLPVDIGVDPVTHLAAGVEVLPDPNGNGTVDIVLTGPQVRPQSLKIVVPFYTNADIEALVVAALGSGATYQDVLDAAPGTTNIDWIRDPEGVLGL